MPWILDIALSGAMYSLGVIVAAWTAGAIFFDIGHGSVVGWVLCTAWTLAVTAAFLLWQPLWMPFVVLLLVFTLFLLWWFRQKPSHDRAWDPNFAKLPHFEIEGDILTIHDLRNTEYRSTKDYTPRFETRACRLSRLSGLDALILYWGSPWMSHPMFVFDFGPDGRVCISVEVRYRMGQRYGFLRSLYRQQEIMYVVSDERDAILKRTAHRKGHDLYLYRLSSTPLRARQFLLDFIDEINKLVAHPRWYNGLTSNCTTSIYAQDRGRLDWDWRILLNGRLDRMLYERKQLDQSQPFESLKAKSRVNDIANSAPTHHFGDHIRSKLEGYRSTNESDQAAED